jgi:hypothetical protein
MYQIESEFQIPIASADYDQGCTDINMQCLHVYIHLPSVGKKCEGQIL